MIPDLFNGGRLERLNRNQDKSKGTLTMKFLPFKKRKTDELVRETLEKFDATDNPVRQHSALRAILWDAARNGVKAEFIEALPDRDDVRDALTFLDDEQNAR